MLEPLVVGWDGGPAGRAALDWALAHAPDGALVEVVHVEEGADAAALPVATRHARARLWAEAQRAGALAPRLRVRGVFAVGDAAAVLARRAGDGGLLVLGAPEAGRRAALARRLAGRTDRSVALVPDAPWLGPVHVGAAPTTEDAVALVGAELAARAGSGLVLVRAGGFGGPVQATAAELADRARAAHPDVPVRIVLTSRSPIDALQRAGEQGALVVVGPHLAGSGTRESLVGRLRCPLLLLGPGAARAVRTRSAVGAAA